MIMSVQFYYDRYIAGKVNSINENVIGNYGFRDPFVSQQNQENPSVLDEISTRVSQELRFNAILNEPYDPWKGSKFADK